MDFNKYVDNLAESAKKNMSDYIDMLYLSGVSRFGIKKSEVIINKSVLNDYLFKRGYSLNKVSNIDVMVKGFTCVLCNDNYIEVWHDKTNNEKHLFIKESVLTSLPIALSYMERI